MADKTYEIEVKTTSDTEGITSVKEALSETKAEADTTRDALEEAFNNATNEVERLEEALMDAEINGDDIGADAIADELSYARQEAEELEAELNNFDSTNLEELNSATQDIINTTEEASSSTEALGDSINSIDSSAIEQSQSSMQEYSNTAKEGADNTDDLMSGLVSVGATTGLVNTFMGLANSAGAYNDSMLRMGISLTGHAMTVEQVSSKYGKSVSKMADETGRGAGSVRNHFANMGVAGVTNTKILEGSFQAIANGSFYSGESIESLSNKFQRITMTGMLSAKQLSGLGLTMSDLASVMGTSADEVSKKFKTMSEEERASVMSTASANKYGTDVNEVFKTSWEGLWTQLDKTKGGFERLVGELLLPYLIPTVQTATSIVSEFTTVFKSLPQPVKMAIGGFLTFATALVTVGLGLNAVFKIGKMIISPFQQIGKLMGVDLIGKARSLANTMKSGVLNAFRSVATFMKAEMIPSLKNVGGKLLELGKNALISGYNALKSAGMWIIQKAQVLASSIANGVATASQWALNIAMDANPIMIVVLAIVALIAVLGYLYFNNEQVRGAIDGLGQAFQFVGQIIYTAFVGAIQWVMGALQNLWSYITTLGGLIPANTSITGNQVIDTILKVLGFFATLPIQIGMILVNIIAKTLGFGNNFAQRMIASAGSMVTGFINRIKQLPGMVLGEFNRITQIVSSFITSLPKRVWDLGKSIIDALLGALGIHSPGFMFYAIQGEFQRIGDVPEDMESKITGNVSRLGNSIVESFNPELDLNSTSVSNARLIGESDSTNGDTINFYFTDTVVDNDDRMEKICDYITQKFNWNSKTTGKTL